MKIIALVFLLCVCCCAQNPPAPPASVDKSAEDQELSNALAEAGSSPIEFTRALERHLEKYPKTQRRGELERALVKAAR